MRFFVQKLLTAFLVAVTTGCWLPYQAVAMQFDEDIQTWQTLGFNFHDGEDWRFTGAVQNRMFDDSSFTGTRLIAPTLQYKAHPNYDLGATYLYEEVRAEAGQDFIKLHIFWLHVSPHWTINDDWRFGMRHVAAYRGIESYDNYWVSRHRFSLNCKLDNYGPLIDVGIGTEIFYNYETDRFCENRLIPLNFCFKLTEKAKLSLYFMAQSKRFGNKDSWDTAYVFGQSVGYRF